MQWLIDITKEWLQLYFQGMIVLWSGAIVDIPDGWHLCDGTEGTPDLRNKFIAGAGDSYAPGASGGSTWHTHGAEDLGHFHTLLSGNDIEEGTGYNDYTNEAKSQPIIHSTTTLPPYYALCYIMKL